MKIITIGSATRDCIIESDKFKVIQEGSSHGKAECLPLGAKVEVDDMFFTTGGGATNTAYTFARQDFQVSVLSKIGDDVSGKEVILDLEKEGIDTSLIRKSDLPTAYSIILLTNVGRTILVYRGAGGDLKPEDFKPKEINADWFYVTSLGGKLELLEKIVNTASEKNIKIALNPGSKELKRGERLKALLDQVTVLLVNKEESLILSGKETISESFTELDQPAVTVITKGKQGVEVVAAGRKYQAGIFPEKKFVDRTGAGDAFGSGFVAGFIHTGAKPGKEDCIKEAIRLGTANSTTIVEHLGAKNKILTKEEYESDERWENLPYLQQV